MTNPTVFTLVLTGAKTGKTIVLNGHQFVEGKLQLRGTAQEVQGLVTYMGKSYAAFLQGSDELTKAQAKGDKDGDSNLHGKTGSGEPNAVPGEAGPDGEGASPQDPDEQPGNDDASAGTAEPVPAGDGHQNPGTDKQGDEDTNEQLFAALKTLDPKNDEHWTADGRPRMDAVEAAYGGAGVTRKLVEATIPGYTREVATSKDAEGGNAKTDEDKGEASGQ